ncbi:MAG: hypothetical protein BWX55_00383 [Deltaproteobacteria bacterium ADurb.Bin022]|nr:MAG: hypothetical protein BWX55_00383 [Deltaproteobacteria bacterium ADurb.Bin022]
MIKILHQILPLRNKRFTLTDNPFHLLIFDIVSADMHSAVSHAFQYGVHPGGAQNSGSFSLIGVVSFPVNFRKQLVRNDGSGQFVAVHHAGRSVRQYIDIAHERNVQGIVSHK